MLQQSGIQNTFQNHSPILLLFYSLRAIWSGLKTLKLSCKRLNQCLGGCPGWTWHQNFKGLNNWINISLEIFNLKVYNRTFSTTKSFRWVVFIFIYLFIWLLLLLLKLERLFLAWLYNRKSPIADFREGQNFMLRHGATF